ncbi:hypothetical protein F441_05238 [Phytophthora nicotianae CJ01A1]|uniref:Uncharacterized protein n=2 Tax=Phytophthora nicotianae TaxID=4792 RepID=W2ZQ40_PHYNI|nr:hypothetical protein F441_05238 [Phytophthora nicotianae CJ01A1]ETP49106.1 hypothetical protein F442_05284 [Phytophthora nicotianae P10297]
MSLQLLKIAIIIPFELMVRDNRAEVDATSVGCKNPTGNPKKKE